MARRCCCDGSCTIWTTDFPESFGDPISSDLSVKSGTWAYDGSSNLVESGTTNALILTTAATRTNEQQVFGSVTSMDVGDKVRIAANAIDDDNYLFVEVEQGGASYTVRLYKRTNGNNVLLTPEETMTPALTVGEYTPLTIKICLSKETFSATIFNQDVTSANQVHYACDPVLFPGGKIAGMGNGGAQDIEIESFYFGDFRGETGLQVSCRGSHICCLQQCLCCVTKPGTTYCIPRTIILTINAYGGCTTPYAIEDLHGYTINLTYQPGSGYWESEENTQPCLSRTYWRFACSVHECATSQGDGDRYNLSLINMDGGACHEDDCFAYYGKWQVTLSCDPAIIEFESAYTGIPTIICECCHGEYSGAATVVITW